jgi:hypothetical protein
MYELLDMCVTTVLNADILDAFAFMLITPVVHTFVTQYPMTTTAAITIAAMAPRIHRRFP